METGRLILREWREEDRQPFAAMNADPEVMRYFQSALTDPESDALVDRIALHFRTHGFGLFALERKSDGAFLGFTGFSSCPENTPVQGEIEIGWRLAQAYWRRGYAHEAASACADWFWQTTDRARLVSYTSAANQPSRNLMGKLGFRHYPERDFDHPAIASDHPFCRQVVYVLNRSDAANG